MSKKKNAQLALAKAIIALDEAMQDASPEEQKAIEQAESDVAKAALAIQKIEAEADGESPKDFGINNDADAVCDEDMKKAMKDKGMDAESASEQKAFAEGVKYGERLIRNNAERKKLDSEHESEGMKKAEDAETEDKATKAMDSAIAFDAKALEARITKGINAKHQAAEDVKPLIGKVNDYLAFDSAEDIYLKACELSKVSATKASAKDVCMVLRQNKGQTYQPAMANDSADISKQLAFLKA